MVNEWIKTTIGKQATLQRGIDITKADQRAGTVPVVSSGGVSSYHDTPAASGPGVVLGRKGVVGSVFFIPSDYWPHDTTLWVKDFHGNDPRFVYFFFKWMAPRIATMDVGSANPTLNRNHVHPIEVRWPPLSEQRAISHILGTLDEKIELNLRMNETLEAMARALFKSWFVDFDPVRAKAEGREPGLPKPLADLFPSRLVDSELGEIPEGWEVGHFGDVVEQLRDQENPLSFPDQLFHHFSIPAFDDAQTATFEYGESIKSLKSRVPAGVTLISKLNPEIERVWMVDVRPGERAVCSTEFLVLRARTPFTRSYVFCLARSPLFRQQIEGLVTGTSKSHQRAQVDSILNLAVIMPLSSIVAAFDRSTDSLLTRTLACRRESMMLALLRDTLLPKLVSGELRLNGAEPIIERLF
ncbi:MAG: restriction endonuclease subunit S [Planctomycetes bacterium]|nr:restriction endonuclease subunit S [Planctomycetota bacterium]MBI3845988.1 restriction endonuclease subunit S [Planctomycetota bacterium]